jgi:hypothetical protein
MKTDRRRFFAVSLGSISALLATHCDRTEERQAADAAAARVLPASSPISKPGFYSTTFPADESSISEGRRWVNNGLLWTKVQTVGRRAFGTNGLRNTYDDSYAYLVGDFGADHQAEATVYRSPNLRGDPHECEILLRWADGPTNARGYECLFNFAGGVQVTRWNGPFGDFTELPGGDGSYRRALRTGDIVKGTVVGTIITCFINGEQVAQASDSTFETGQPGMGFFKRLPGKSTDLGFCRYTARAL